MTSAQLSDETAVIQWTHALQERINALNKEPGVNYLISVQADINKKYFYPKIIAKNHGFGKEYLFKLELLNSNDYKYIIESQAQIHDLLDKDGYVQRGDKRQPFSDFSQLYAWLVDEAKKGLVISRYKGLGEMNPDQLWETTMDPQSRRLLRVNIQDVVSADEIFTTLMGDQVEPRRQFIEDNALSAENIDV